MAPPAAAGQGLAGSAASPSTCQQTSLPHPCPPPAASSDSKANRPCYSHDVRLAPLPTNPGRLLLRPPGTSNAACPHKLSSCPQGSAGLVRDQVTTHPPLASLPGRPFCPGSPWRSASQELEGVSWGVRHQLCVHRRTPSPLTPCSPPHNGHDEPPPRQSWGRCNCSSKGSRYCHRDAGSWCGGHVTASAPPPPSGRTCAVPAGHKPSLREMATRPQWDRRSDRPRPH